jgi:hypothetical protein
VIKWLQPTPPHLVPPKKKVLCIKGEVKQIQQIENGGEMADVCQEFDHGNSTIQTIWKNRTKIINAFEHNH